MARVLLSQIAFDAGTQIRAALNESVVTSYAERMTEGDTFPPIVLFSDGCSDEHGAVIYYIADGFHRAQAALRNQFRDIDADVRPGTKQDALWFALGANRANGQRLTDADKTHAATLALRQWATKTHREIAEQVGCSESLVSKVWAAVAGNNTSGETGIRGQALKTSLKREAVKQMVSGGATSIAIKEALGAHTTMIAEVRAELGVPSVNRSKAAVAQRRKDIRDMAERGFTSKQIAAAVGIDERSVPAIAKSEGITIHADRVVGKTRRHDSTRIVEQMVMDAENMTADVNLIDFASLDRASIPLWVDAFIASQKSLAAFIRRLKQEQKNVEAA